MVHKEKVTGGGGKTTYYFHTDIQKNDPKKIGSFLYYVGNQVLLTIVEMMSPIFFASADDALMRIITW